MKKVLLTITLLLSFASTQPCLNDIENTNCLIATGLIGDFLVGGGVTATIIGYKSIITLASASSNTLYILGLTVGTGTAATAGILGALWWNIQGKCMLLSNKMDISSS